MKHLRAAHRIGYLFQTTTQGRTHAVWWNGKPGGICNAPLDHMDAQRASYVLTNGEAIEPHEGRAWARHIVNKSDWQNAPMKPMHAYACEVKG